MTGKERYMAMIEGKPVDYLPRIPILMQYAAEYIGSDYAAFAADYKVLVESNIVCAREFGIDQVSCISDPYRETQGFGSEIEYKTDGPPRSTHPLAADKDMAKLQTPDPLASERMLDRIMAARAYKEQLGDEYSILGWIEGPAAEAADLRDVINFLMDVVDDEAYACDLMDLCVEVGIDFARAQHEAGCDTIGIGDAIASQVSPDVYERLILPREQRLVDGIKKTGALVKLHICGNITHLLPGIKTLDIDVIDVDHMVDIKQVREVLGPDITIGGNIDPSGGILSGTPDTIKAYTDTIYSEVGNPFMVGAGCEIPAGTPAENLKALCEPVPYRA
jgi:MtaA/CmuA family methyltransferase